MSLVSELGIRHPTWRVAFGPWKGSVVAKRDEVPASPLMGRYPEKTIIEKGTCTPMFTAALFTIAKTWKQPRRPSTGEQIKKLWYTYTMEYYSAQYHK